MGGSEVLFPRRENADNVGILQLLQQLNLGLNVPQRICALGSNDFVPGDFRSFVIIECRISAKGYLSAKRRQKTTPEADGEAYTALKDP